MIRKQAIYCYIHVFCALFVQTSLGSVLEAKPLPLPTEKTETSTTMLGIWEVCWALLIIACLIFAIQWILRRSGVGVLPTTGSSQRAIRIIERKPLGARQSLVLVRCRETEVLLHQSKGKLSTLCVIEPSKVESTEEVDE